MKKQTLNGFLALALLVGTTPWVLAAETAAGEPVMDQSRNLYSEGRQDPPGVLNNAKFDSVRRLALSLSANRKWMSSGVLKTLDTMAVRVDEIFTEAPQLVEVEGRLYRLVLEKVGSGWQGFNPRSSAYLLFLDHDTFDGYGENFALAFQNGKERRIVQEDLEKTAALGLSLKEVSLAERLAQGARTVGIEQPIRLGKVAPRFRSTQLTNVTANSGTGCLPESAPTSCSNGVPVCSSPNAFPYFVLSSVLIKTDHEDAFSGNPDIELFPLRYNVGSPFGGTSDVRTDWIFDGRTVTDLMGRSRYLPDVNNNYTWYSVSGGLALFPSQVSSQWAPTLIEDDDTKGRLKVDRSRPNPIRRRDALIPVFPFDYFDVAVRHAINFVNLVVTLDILDDSDDLYVESLEVSNATFCSESLGQPFPHNLLFDSSEWSLQGYFACIDPTCVPPPPPYEEPACPKWGCP